MEPIRKRIDSLIPYISFRVLEKIAADPGYTRHPIETLQGAILHSDVVGFTELVGNAVRSGTAATEGIQRAFTEYFTGLIGIVRAYGGVVYHFGGDSILAGFIQDADETEATAVLRYVSCALEIAGETDERIAERGADRSLAIRHKISLACGEYHHILLRGKCGTILPAIIGPPVLEAIITNRLAGAGGVLIDDRIRELLPETLPVEEVEGLYRLSCAPPKVPFRPYLYELRSVVYDQSFLERCSSFIAAPLRQKIINSVQDFLGDFREVTCLFIRFLGVGIHERPADEMKALQSFYEFVQEKTDLLSGTLLQIEFSIEGIIFLILFGAPNAVEGKEHLACRLALRILEARKEFPFLIAVQAGIATGPVFSGDLGAPFRKSYTVVGKAINLAARLVRLVNEDSIFVDRKTEPLLRKNYVLQEFPETRLKGFDEAQSVFRLEKEIHRFRGINTLPGVELIGRRAELDELLEILVRTTEGSGQLCLLQGHPGIGKSTLVHSFLKELINFNAEPLLGRCFSYERYTPFYPWKELLSLYFQIFDPDSGGEKLRKIGNEFNLLDKNDRAWLPVLCGLLGMDIPEEPMTAELEPRQKNRRIFNIITRLLWQRSRSTPLVLVFEDLHWADEISLDLIRHIADSLNGAPIMLLLVQRPAEIVTGFTGRNNSSLISLKELPSGDARLLLRKRMQLVRPDSKIEDVILAHAQGNPLYLESVVHGLRDGNQLIALPDGQYRLAGERGSLKIPTNLQDVIVSQFDRLPEIEQYILKTSAVIGNRFTLGLLEELIPEEFRSEVPGSLARLSESFLTPIPTEPVPTFMFQHALIRDVAYNSLLLARRREIHHRLADCIRRNTKALNGVAENLVFHYLAAEEWKSALTFTLLAARKARRHSAGQNAAHYYQTACELIFRLNDDSLLPEYQNIREELAGVHRQEGNYYEAIRLYTECLNYQRKRNRRADLYIGLGTVYQERGDAGRAVAEFETALRLMGQRPPRGVFGTRLAIGRQLVIRMLHGILPTSLLRLSRKRADVYRRRLDLLVGLAKNYFIEDLEKVAWTGFSMINLAERLQGESELSLAGGNYAVILAGMGFLKKSERYFRQSLNRARRAGNPTLEALALSRMVLLGACHNDPEFMRNNVDQGLPIFEQIGEMWEVQTCLSMAGVTALLSSDLERMEAYFDRMEKIARRVNSTMHIGWTYSIRMLCRYMLCRYDYGEVVQDYNDGLGYSTVARDNLNIVALHAYRALIAMHEGLAEDAALMAFEAGKILDRYRFLVPHTQMCNVYAAETALFALRQMGRDPQTMRLRRLIRRCVRRALRFGKTYPYIRGSSLRVQALVQEQRGNRRRARKMIEKALEITGQEPNPWERGLACLDGGRILEERRSELFEQAWRIFSKHNLPAELRRLRSLESSLSATQDRATR